MQQAVAGFGDPEIADPGPEDDDGPDDDHNKELPPESMEGKILASFRYSSGDHQLCITIMKGWRATYLFCWTMHYPV